MQRFCDIVTEYIFSDYDRDKQNVFILKIFIFKYSAFFFTSLKLAICNKQRLELNKKSYSVNIIVPSFDKHLTCRERKCQNKFQKQRTP